MEKRLRWGILSTARINKAIIPGLQTSDRHELRAVASRSFEKARQYASEWSIPVVHTSYEDLLADPEIDAIYNPLPNDLHAEYSIRAAQAGKHVLCEKPIALSTEEVDAIQRAAEDAGVVVMEALMYRFHPQTKKVQEIVQQGLLGKILLMRGTFTFQLTRPDDYRWKPEAGGGGLWDVGVYPVSYARMIAGEPPEEVFGYQQLTESGVDGTFTGELRFNSGALAQVSSSILLPFHTGFQIRGSEGSLYIPHPFKSKAGAQITLQRGENEEEFRFAEADLYQLEADEVADAIEQGRPPSYPLEESRENIATLSALLESASSGQPVRI